VPLGGRGGGAGPDHRRGAGAGGGEPSRSAGGSEAADLGEPLARFAKAAFQPTVSASVSGSGKLQAGDGDAVSTGLDGSISLRWNLYDGGSKQADVAQAGRELEASTAKVTQQRQAVVVEAIDRFFAAATARELVTVREDGLSSNRQQLEKVRAQYEAGSRSITDVYSQEAEVEKASSSLISAVGALEEALLSLAVTTGLTAEVQGSFRWGSAPSTPTG